MSNEGLFTNHAGAYVTNAFSRIRDCRVRIASAFFSDVGMVQELANRRCPVELIVRLGPGTSDVAMANCVGIPGVTVRYYTHESFHPKLYIFGNRCALVGSANLTRSGLGRPDGNVNQEAAVLVEGDDPRFEELCGYFEALWTGAGPFCREEAARYCLAAATFPPPGAGDNAVRHHFEEIRFNNLGNPNADGTRGELYRREYKARLQKALDAIAVVAEAYDGLGQRKDARLPMHIEVDQFFNFIRCNRAAGETYLEAPLRAGRDQLNNIRNAAEDYLHTAWPYLAEIAENRYPRMRVLQTPDAIAAASDDDLWAALSVVHALEERQRFYRGGLPTLRAAIFANGSDRIKSTLTYLIHGAEPAIDRIVECHYGGLRLANLGESFLQEMLGWAKPAELPICNGRTLIALRWLGFDVGL